MNNTSTLWQRLQAAGLTRGDAPPDAGSPWYIKVLLALSGWLAALFLLSFSALFFTVLFDNEVTRLIAGGLLIAASYGMLRIPKGEFIEHLALAIGLTGQMACVWAILELTDFNRLSGAAISIVFFAALAIIIPNFIYRFCATLGATIAASFLLTELRLSALFSPLLMLPMCWLWLNELRHPKRLAILQPVAYALVIALIVLKGTALFATPNIQDELPITTAWLDELLVLGILFYLVWQLLTRHQLTLRDRATHLALAATLVFALLSFEATGLSTALIIMLLGFAIGNRLLLGLGIAALLFYISAYYYMLHVTLLEKSITLALIGLLLLGARRLMLQLPARGSNHD